MGSLASASPDQDLSAVPAPASWRGLAALCTLMGVATITLTILGNGNVAAGAAVPLGFAALWVIWKRPVRDTLLLLIFLGLTLESPNEIPANGAWRSPIYIVGQLMLSKWNDVFGPRALVLTGVDMLVLFLVAALAWRRSRGSTLDTSGQVQTANVMAFAVLATLAGTLWVWGYGIARGGNFGNSLLQIHKLLYVPLLFFVCHAALRGPRDHAAIAKVMIGAAVVKSLLALYIQKTVTPPKGETMLGYATTHGDSMLFAGAIGLILALINERVGKGRRGFLALLLVCAGIICVGMWANHRRVAWVEVALIAIAFYAISPWTRLRRAVARTLLAGLPVFAIYLAIGWNSGGGGVFAPVKTVRSILDSKSDGSTMWRDMENLNLVDNIIEHPLLGSGLGHEYREDYKLPDVSTAFPLYRLVPHNSVLGFLSYAGLIGFSLMWCCLVMGVFLAARAYRASEVPLDRAIALWAIGTLIAYINSIYGDMGQSSWTAVFTVCPALALVGKLAVASGAWPARKRRPRPGDARRDEAVQAQASGR